MPVPTIIEHYQDLLRAGDTDAANAALTLAAQVPAYRAEAQLWRGMDALNAGRCHEAFLLFSQAAQAQPQRPEIAALMGRAAMGQHQPQLARQLLEAAWRKHPTHPALRIALWQARLATQPAAQTVSQMLTALEYVEDAGELRFVLNKLAELTPPGTQAGAVRYLAGESVISGWAVNLHAPRTPAALRLSLGERSVEFAANTHHPLLREAGWPSATGFRVRVSPQREPAHISTTGPQPADLTGSPLALAPVLPGVPGFPARGFPARGFPTKESPPPQPADPSAKPRSATPIDVLIPVFEGYDETLACIQSVLRHRQANRSKHEIVVLNDASPNAKLRQALVQLARAGHITLVQRPANLGFIRNMNRGMALHPDRDVVWLNADTQVHGNWLDRLRTAAYASRNTASAAPLSNNGELLSFPESRVCHPMPDAEELAQLDNLAKKLAAAPVPIETGCGFCLYIKRRALDEVGYLDEIELLRGYGEETDWCLRASQQGWQHVAAPNVFVAHQGGVSFGDEKVLRVKHNNDVLRKRYPLAEAQFEAFTRRDPLKIARRELQRTRLPGAARRLKTLHHTDNQDTMDNSRTLYITGGLREQAGLPPVEAPLRLNFRNQGAHAIATLHISSADSQPLSVDYALPEDDKRLVQDLRKLPIDRLVYDQASGCPDTLLALPETLARPHIVRSLPAGTAQTSAALMRLLNTAKAIQVPYAAQVLIYSKALPNATITTLATPPLDIKPGVLASLPSILVADALHHSSATRHWIQLARQLARQHEQYGHGPKLLVPGNTPWQEELLATGIASRLPEAEGVSHREALALAGCAVAISLDNCPDASWLAPELARNAGLSLYAPNSAVARQAGAYPLSELSGVAPWLALAA